MRHVNLVLRLVLAGIFLYASYDKLLHPAEFAKAVWAYRLLPDALVNPVAVGLPWLELVLGLALIANRWTSGALFWANLLFAGFLAGIAVNFIRGVDVHCGCFTSAATGSPDMLGYLLRDTLFLALGVAAAWTHGRDTGPLRRGEMVLATPFGRLCR